MFISYYLLFIIQFLFLDLAKSIMVKNITNKNITNIIVTVT